MTNFEKLKSMTVFELANFLQVVTSCCFQADCESCPMKPPVDSFETRKKIDYSHYQEWLESEVKEP